MKPIPSSATDDTTLLARAWRLQLERIGTDARAILAQFDTPELQAMSNLFYDELQGDPRALRFLSSQQVQQRLKPSMQRWLRDLLRATVADVDTLVATNHRVGQVHARIDIPVDLVARGMRVLRRHLCQRIVAAGHPPQATHAALIGLNTSMDIAIEGMTLAYADAHDRSARTEAAYRLFSLVQNVGTERERQRALLLDWENTLLYSLAGHDESPESLQLSSSEFGLWFVHKGIPSFGENAETQRISELVSGIDTHLRASPYGALGREALQAIRSDLAAIRHLLAMLFERIGELDAGSDALTNLLNRRFLPPVLRREMELANRTGRAFALIAMDLDHFKQVNDEHGHDIGDRVLQHLAALLDQHTRGSDYVFRLGGEEFLVVVVAVTDKQALGIAEGLRHHLATSPVTLPNGQALPITASFGVALFNGDPDYERLMARSDAAMYEAKRAGRNRVQLASDDVAPAVRRSPESRISPYG